MNFYDRIFGSGPRGALLAIASFILVYYFADYVGLGDIFTNDVLRYSLSIVFSSLGCAVVIWSVISLPPIKRGRSLVTRGAYKYLRHPLYSAFLLFLNFSVAIFLNNWIYIIWAFVMFPIWSVNVRSEEALMRREFGEEYDVFCRETWRFFPKLYS